ncbi:thermonuclease family protein [Pseudoroseicyclus sp. H15]
MFPIAAAAQSGDEPAPPEVSGEVTGAAEVIDADILVVGGQQRVILWGIDAPERSQTCRLDSREWGCYDAARRALQSMAERGEVTCTLYGEPDPFNRYYGQCLSNGEDLGEAMVKAGLAMAYLEQTDDYELAQIDAITAGVGLWQPGAEFVEPWEFRRTNTPGGYR